MTAKVPFPTFPLRTRPGGPWRPTPNNDPLPSRIGGFQILEELGSGSLGTVYRARDSSNHEVLALKALWPGASVDEAGVPALLDRIQEVNRRSELGIVPIWAFGEADRCFYWVMPYMAGGSLDDLLQQRMLEPEETAMVGSQLAGALVRAHAAGLVHGDVKPTNVLLDERGSAYLSDFGMAAVVRPALGAPMAPPTDGVAPYKAPEVLRGARPSPASDIWALGAVLYESLAGRPPDPPVAGPGQPAGSVSFAPTVPVGLAAAIRQALAADPRDRFPNAGAFADAIVRASACRPLTVSRRAPASGHYFDAAPSEGGDWTSPLVGRGVRVETYETLDEEEGSPFARVRRAMGLDRPPRTPGNPTGRHTALGLRVLAGTLVALIALGALAGVALRMGAFSLSGTRTTPPQHRPTAVPSAPPTAPALQPSPGGVEPGALPPPVSQSPQVGQSPQISQPSQSPASSPQPSPAPIPKMTLPPGSISIPLPGQLLPNGGFERGLAGWHVTSTTPGVSMKNPPICGEALPVQAGRCYDVVEASQGGRSVYADTGREVAPGQYMASCWFRSGDGSPLPGRLALNGVQDGQGGFVNFDAQSAWRQMILRAPLTSAESDLQLVVYVDTANRSLDIANCSVVRMGG